MAEDKETDESEEMITIKWYIETDYVGSRMEGEIKIEDDYPYTDSEIDQIVHDEIMQRIEWGWEKEEK